MILLEKSSAIVECERIDIKSFLFNIFTAKFYHDIKIVCTSYIKKIFATAISLEELAAIFIF